MEYEATIQSVLDEIDRRIEENIRIDELARAANYSTYHFCRVFMALTGMPVMSYVTRRKLEYAQCDLSQGKRIIDVAMAYGFDTHAGFAKAFKKCFGFPPSLCHLRIANKTPERATINSLKRKHGGFSMNPYIIVMTPFTVAGRTLRQKSPSVKHHADIPAFCFTDEYEGCTDNLLTDTSQLFSKSDAIKHCEISMCYDVDPAMGEFTYLLGRGIFHPDDLKRIPPDMVRFEINGLYAVFSTPPVPFEQHDRYAQVIQDTWNDIFTKWLPNAEFAYDETRKDYEYYDYRDHGWYFENKRQMDICIPIRQREEAKRISQEKGKILWEQEMKRLEQK
ncbi:MAG: helix-turn-helix domain-containing protein [Oscillospiraceae bacterium]|nr:helix-turn-helix domain-containing protein [Oscillospiraceae bacterium]